MVVTFDEGVYGFPRSARTLLEAPNDVALHVRSDQGIQKDGTNLVSQWSDISMYGRHFVQATASNQPLFVQNNGYPVIRHDGVDNYLAASLAKFALATIAIVFRPNDAPATKGLFSWASTPVSTTPYVLVQRYSGNIRYYLNGNYRFNFAAATGTVYLHILQWTGIQWELYVNGDVVPLTYAVQGGNGATVFYLGSGYNGYPAVDFAECIVYNKSLSKPERELLQLVLNNDYAIW